MYQIISNSNNYNLFYDNSERFTTFTISFNKGIIAFDCFIKNLYNFINFMDNINTNNSPSKKERCELYLRELDETVSQCCYFENLNEFINEIKSDIKKQLMSN